MWHSCQKKLEMKIHAMPSGSVFGIADFSELASPKTVSKMLARLEGENGIERVLRGIYWKPDGIHSSPSPDRVAKALARENAWQLVPCGATALHLFGLKKETPEEWTYVTDGTYRHYSYDGKKISFLRTTGRILGTMSEKTALLVQVLKAYGKEHITDEIIAHIASFFNSEEAKRVLAETRNTTEWIADVILRIFCSQKEQKRRIKNQE
ncbi:MAG: hypothetical protein E7606_04025 [Ruminococcaceae bacterium]|nr:hypothetical protein [Oscillospiraceae bacterium]